MNHSTFYSEDGLRKSYVFEYKGVWNVDMYDTNVLIESREIKGHSQQYAEDLAENFVMYVGEFA